MSKSFSLPDQAIIEDVKKSLVGNSQRPNPTNGGYDGSVLLGVENGKSHWLLQLEAASTASICSVSTTANSTLADGRPALNAGALTMHGGKVQRPRKKLKA